MVSRISTSLTAQLVSILASESLDTERLCKESGIDIEELSSQSKFISRSSFLQLMDLAEIESSNPNIGLKAHHQLLPGAFQLVGYAMISSATLKDALLALVRFSTLLGNGFTIKLTQEKSGMRLWHSDNSEGKAKKSRAFSDVILSSTMGLCRRMTGGRRPIAREVEFIYPMPKDISEHQQIFDCTLHFDRNRNSILFFQEALSIPLSTANEALAVLHESLAEHQKHHLNNGYFSERTRSSLIKRLGSAPCDIDSVAKELNTNARILQRELAKEGNNFKKILDSTRKKLAEHYLINYLSYSLEHICTLLSFKEISSLHKACLRWFGTPPGSFRSTNAGTNLPRDGLK
ncbi:AraC family transcriptional regulator [Pseudomonas aeruginosa]|nr:AraC family transcriptional regulator [Pseudomonas aeruginosa]RUE71374.1 AraC family transcriptional regulator [Pseudomonas aeruginosa]HBP5515972.1 AraC family transcriptional regulator [Pseudomonas aeruginosa]